MPRYSYAPFPYQTPPELAGGTSSDAPVAIVGAGPIGLAAAIDLALHGIKTVVLDDNNVVSVGSRAICWAKRTLEIFDRLGIGDRMLAKGVTWKVGRLFHGDREVYSFDLLPEPAHKMPAFLNLQQYHVEQYLVERCADFSDLIDLRWKNRVTGLRQDQDRVQLTVETPDGPYTVGAAYVLACDGSKSAVRGMVGVDLVGDAFEEKFLIADIEMDADFPNERWFWFEPAFHKGQTALLHKQPDNIYRIDLQLGWDADPAVERREDVVTPRIEAAVRGRPFTLDWVSVYSFRCARLERFIENRVIFVGDSAHVVSPFGARGGNGGIQDVDNVCWKLASVLNGTAGPGLLASYNEERVHGSDENIKHSTRASDFMSPPDDTTMLFRDAVLDLAQQHPFARRLINSGRLSTPCSLDGKALQSPTDGLPLVAGAPCPDAPLADGWLLNRLGGDFALLCVGTTAPATALRTISVPAEGMLFDRYGQGVYLVRPDQHIAAGWPNTPSAATITAALTRATGH